MILEEGSDPTRHRSDDTDLERETETSEHLLFYSPNSYKTDLINSK
jgi:hypothetical protein